MTEQGRQVRIDRFPMRWGEMDALGHLNNVSYFRFFEQARIAWFDSMGIDYGTIPEAPVLGTISCRFVKSAVYPVDIEVTTWVGKPGRSSFGMWHRMTRADDPAVIFAEADSVMVWIAMADGKSRPLPDWVRSELTIRR